MKLLLRLYDPDSGSLFIDDHDLRTLTQVILNEYMISCPDLFKLKSLSYIVPAQNEVDSSKLTNAESVSLIV